MTLIKTSLVLAATLFASAASAALTPFNINVVYGSGLSESQKQIIAQAESFWESKLTSYAQEVSFPAGLTIHASGVTRDGVGGVLGSAGPQTAYYENSLYYASTGRMEFDVADLGWLESNNSLYTVMAHEMAHVIGFGTLWTYNNLYVNGSGRYTGQHALNAYRAEFDPTATFVPAELDGGPGTADGHWDESWLGGSSDIMTGYLEGVTTLSNTTLSSFRDLGYAVALNQLPTPTPVSAGFAGLGIALLMLRRKKNSI